MREEFGDKIVRIDATDRTPEVFFDLDNGIFVLEGRSIPEDTSNFYQRLLPYVYKYGQNPKPITKVSICLEYFNTTTSKFLAELFRELTRLKDIGQTNPQITWWYYTEDELMRETGEEYQEYFPKLPFSFEEKPAPEK